MAVKKINITKLELTNYRNIKHAVYEFDGNSKIIGENRIGKTNTLESICFLLTNKLLNGSSEVECIKPIDDTKATVIVEAIFKIDDKEVTLKKEYGEEWVKQRNTQELIFKGHFTNYYYNGVKQTTIKDYQSLISADFGYTQNPNTKVDYTTLLINPFYLGNLGEDKDWTSLRTFIIDLVGDVSDEDVFAKEPSTCLIKYDLENVNGRIDQLKKQFKNESDGLNETIIGNDAQIELLEKTSCPTDEEIAVAKKGIKDLDDEILSLKSKNGADTLSSDLRLKIANKQNEIFELENKEKAELSKTGNDDSKVKLNELYAHSGELVDKKTEINTLLINKRNEIKVKESKLNESKDKRNCLINKIKEIDIKIDNPVLPTECPTCHRPFDAEVIEKTKADYLNGLKAERETIIKDGLANKELMNRLDFEISNLGTEIIKLEQELEDVENKLNDNREECEKLRLQDNPVVEYVPSDAVNKLKAEKQELENKLAKSSSDYLSAQNEINNQIYEKEQAKVPFQKVLDDKAYYDRQMDQLKIVKSEKEINSKKLIDVEQKRDLVNKYIFTKLKMLDDNVAKVFGNIKFQLIKQNINGGFDPICKPYIYNIDKDESTNVSWRSGSKSEQVITGIAIAEKIKAKLELPNMPFLFDEGGEISTDTFKTKFKTDAQIICVKVQDNVPSPMVLAI